MKLLLSSLLLGSLCAISSRSASSTDIVTQTPDVSVTEGDALNITCCFNSMAERIKFYWQKNLKEIGNQMEGNGTVITVVPRGISDGNTVLHTFGGNKDTLSKAETKTLLEKELPSLIKAAKNQAALTCAAHNRTCKK
ncbi:unnamed protein product [Pleuronectes platessa]|uniref:Ig-like domain-containing protein n=1 Tax=Pleuronectes platessa TaxID=8262 RepID=A0A9N7TNP3_PLEPL|nr:unnamed protein product [Pleuronectes platessa]